MMFGLGLCQISAWFSFFSVFTLSTKEAHAFISVSIKR